MSISTPKAKNQCFPCAPLKEKPASQDHPKLMTRMFSIATEEGTSWLNLSEQTTPGKNVAQKLLPHFGRSWGRRNSSANSQYLTIQEPIGETLSQTVFISITGY